MPTIQRGMPGYDFAKCSEKVHEIENVFYPRGMRRGCCSWGRGEGGIALSDKMAKITNRRRFKRYNFITVMIFKINCRYFPVLFFFNFVLFYLQTTIRIQTW